jgi:hypothetical protein
VNTLNTRVPQVMLRTPSEANNEEKSKKVSQLTQGCAADRARRVGAEG